MIAQRERRERGQGLLYKLEQLGQTRANSIQHPTTRPALRDQTEREIHAERSAHGNSMKQPARTFALATSKRVQKLLRRTPQVADSWPFSPSLCAPAIHQALSLSWPASLPKASATSAGRAGTKKAIQEKLCLNVWATNAPATANHIVPKVDAALAQLLARTVRKNGNQRADQCLPLASPAIQAVAKPTAGPSASRTGRKASCIARALPRM